MNVAELIIREGLRKGLRIETIKTYRYTVEKFLRIYKKEPHQVTKDDIERHILQLIRWNRAGSTINVHVHALRFFYEKILGKRLTMNIPIMKVRKRLPEYLSQGEIQRFFAVIKNSKHKLIVMFSYGSGFRVSEIIKLKVEDIDLTSGHGKIRDGKGGKDRIFIIPDKLKKTINNWIKQNKLKSTDWLFSGYNDKHYSDSSVQQIVKKACEKAGISKKISPHSLRHSFATHLLENGYSLFEVKELLGHSRLETTKVYSHISYPKLVNVKSPLDTLADNENSKS